MTRLSALLCVRNEEARIEECLHRLAFCDEVVVVADRCTDRTETLAARAGARVISGFFPLEGHRKHAGLDACTGGWILELDADEVVDDALALEIRLTIERDPEGDYFQVPIDNYIGRKLVRHGWGGSFGTSSAVRLYRRGVKRWKAERVHPGAILDGAFAGKLAHPMRHMVDENIGDMVERLNRYTALRAADLVDSGKLTGLWDNAFRGVRRFWKCYVSRKGYKEGELGFLIAVMAALYPLLSYLKARELMAETAASVTALQPATPITLRPR
ncbi:MAG: glycosyl transferase [Caulobacterales bacterium 68-7]|nr:glycosyltransferase family 2 protein [Caulobacterales bacterium]OJU13965.1 MAG: glycosyl transferase [Caulobacterales bacterium 68-7]